MRQRLIEAMLKKVSRDAGRESIESGCAPLLCTPCRRVSAAAVVVSATSSLSLRPPRQRSTSRAASSGSPIVRVARTPGRLP